MNKVFHSCCQVKRRSLGLSFTTTFRCIRLGRRGGAELRRAPSWDAGRVNLAAQEGTFNAT